ncbi:hypothetical protein SRHO_G00252170, partial [Serrasalmus rhombeus]
RLTDSHRRRCSIPFPQFPFQFPFPFRRHSGWFCLTEEGAVRDDCDCRRSVSSFSKGITMNYTYDEETFNYYEEKYYSYEDPTQKAPTAVGIVSSFFIIASLCVGIPALIWSLHSLYVCRKSGGRISVFIVFLLINVLLQSAFSPPAIMFHLEISCRSKGCYWTFILFGMAEVCGLYLHQLVALESVLHLRHPVYTADLFSLPCSVTLSISVYLFAFACAAIFDICAFCLPSIGILIVTFILTFKAPPSHHDTVTKRRPRQWVLAVAMVTAIVLYVPSLVTLYLQKCYMNVLYEYRYEFFSIQYLWAAVQVTSSLRSLRLISDTLLCVLVCKKVLPAQPEQLHAEPNSVI